MENVSERSFSDGDKVSFPLYEPSKKTNWLTANLVVCGSWILCIGFFWLFDDPNSSGNSLRTLKIVVTLCLLGISAFFLVTSFFTYKPLNGKMDAEIAFSKDGITVDEKYFGLNNIANLDFFFINYYGEKNIGFSANFNPILSQGVANWVSFTDQVGNNNKFYFQQQFKEHYRDLIPFIKSAIRANKIGLKRAIDLVGIDDISM